MDRSPFFAAPAEGQTRHNHLTQWWPWTTADSMKKLLSLHDNTTADGNSSCVLRWEHVFFNWMKDENDQWRAKHVGCAEYLSFETTDQLSLFEIEISALGDWFVWVGYITGFCDFQLSMASRDPRQKIRTTMRSMCLFPWLFSCEFTLN